MGHINTDESWVTSTQSESWVEMCLHSMAKGAHRATQPLRPRRGHSVSTESEGAHKATHLLWPKRLTRASPQGYARPGLSLGSCIASALTDTRRSDVYLFASPCPLADGAARMTGLLSQRNSVSNHLTHAICFYSYAVYVLASDTHTVIMHGLARRYAV